MKKKQIYYLVKMGMVYCFIRSGFDYYCEFWKKEYMAGDRRDNTHVHGNNC